MTNPLTTTPIIPLPDGQPLLNHVNNYYSVLEEGFSSLPKENPIQSLQVLMIKVHQNCLALVGQFQLNTGAVNEGSPIFSHSFEILVTSLGIECPIPSYFSQNDLNSTFYSSHHFAAFKITYHDEIQPASVNFQTALGDIDSSYIYKNFRLQRIADQWVPFNQLRGLKFCETFPPYLEIRVHEREEKLIDDQRRKLEIAQNEIMRIKEKQLQIVDKKSHLEAEKTELEKQLASAQNDQERDNLKEEIFKSQQRIKEINKQLEKTEPLIQKNLSQFSSEVNKEITRASHNPILRALIESEINEITPKLQQLILCLSNSISLTTDNFSEAFSTFIPLHTVEFKKEKLHFFNDWMGFLSTEYIKTLHPIMAKPVNDNEKTDQVLLSKEEQAKETLNTMKAKFDTLKELFEIEGGFLNLFHDHPLGKNLLFNKNQSYLEDLRTQMNSLEKELDGFIHSSLDNLVRKDEEKYLCSSLKLYHTTITHLNQSLEKRGLINTKDFGEKRYLSASNYPEERSLLDRNRFLLSYCAFFPILELYTPSSISSINSILPSLAQDVKEGMSHLESPIHINQIPLITLLKECPPFYPALKSDSENFLKLYTELDQMIQTEASLDTIAVKWRECRQHLRKISGEIQKIPFPKGASIQERDYDRILDGLLKAIDHTSDTHSKTTKLKSSMKKSTLFQKVHLAIGLKNELDNLLQGEKDQDKIDAFNNGCSLLNQIISEGIQFLEKALSGFPKLMMHTWLSYNDRYELKKHLYWPTQQKGDPFYESNSTHLSIV